MSPISLLLFSSLDSRSRHRHFCLFSFFPPVSVLVSDIGVVATKIASGVVVVVVD